MLAAAVTIWHLGPVLGIAERVMDSPANRTWAIAGILLLWMLNHLRRYWLARRKEKQFQKDLTGASPNFGAGSLQEQADLAAKFEESLQDLKQHLGSGRFGSQYLYQLPWYIIIGRSRAGKTTALSTAELNYFRKVKGLGSTQNCDWFFTDEAVLIDTAGRYIEQDSGEAVDREGWQAFLDLLRKYRSRRPINGILVAVNIDELLRQDKTDRARNCVEWERLQDILERLGIRFPIYLLFTKCDLLAGFVEYFDDLGVRERSQVWGITLPLYTDLHMPQSRVQDDFNREFQALEQRLHQRFLRRLQDERDRQRRELIYTFPQQFSAIRPAIEQFLMDICRPNMRKELPLIRGVYFTSGTQEGTPIDRVMASLAQIFRLSTQALPAFSRTRGRSYFITRLLREVIFPEAGLANTNLRLERRLSWLQRTALIGIVALIGLLTTVWLVSYRENQNFIQHAGAQLNQLKNQAGQLDQNSTSVSTVLPLLDAARDLPGGYSHRGDSWLAGFGLSQTEKLGDRAIDTYGKLLEEALLPRLMIHLEEELRQGSRNAERLYETLKVYLMLNDTRHFSAKSVMNWLKEDWRTKLRRNVTDDQRESLHNHLAALLEKFPRSVPVELDPDLIQSVQDRLRAISPDRRVYDRLKTYGLGQELPAFNIGEAAGPDVMRVFERNSGKYLSEGIPGFFTYKGYHEVFRPVARKRLDQFLWEPWVTGNQLESLTPDARRQILENVQKSYLEDYAKQWTDLLKDMRIKPLLASDMHQTIGIVKILSHPANSPLRKLLAAIDRETSLWRSPESAVNEEEKDDKSLYDKITGKLKDAATAAESLGDPLPEDRLVDDRFAWLHDFIKNDITTILNGLDELYRALDTVAGEANPGGSASGAAEIQANSIILKLRQQSSHQPEVNNLVQTVTNDAGNLVNDRRCAYLNGLWISEVLPFCRQAVNGRYPLNAESSGEITLEDFGQFFGAGGLIDQFFQNHLKEFVDVSHVRWRWGSSDRIRSCASQDALSAFQYAEAIKKAFFRGAQTPSVSFWLTPISMDVDVDQFLLDVGGQVLTYAFQPVRPILMSWPSPDNIGQIRYRFNLPGGGSIGVDEKGPWAWFRILDSADLSPTPGTPDVLNVTFRKGPHWASAELRATSAFNPFNFNELRKFRCPERLK